jgi:hypothetical protein
MGFGILDGTTSNVCQRNEGPFLCFLNRLAENILGGVLWRLLLSSTCFYVLIIFGGLVLFVVILLLHFTCGKNGIIGRSGIKYALNQPLI